MNQIVIQPKNPRDVVPDDLRELAESIHSAHPKYKVRIEAGEGYTGYAVTLNEVISVWIIGPITGVIVENVARLALRWARERFRQKGTNRPKTVFIYDSKGGELKSITIKNPTDDPEDQTNPTNIYRPKPPIEVKRRFLRWLWFLRRK